MLSVLPKLIKKCQIIDPQKSYKYYVTVPNTLIKVCTMYQTHKAVQGSKPGEAGE